MFERFAPGDVVRYEARPTRMFGSYTLWAILHDGREFEIGHGAPQSCLAEAERRNAALLKTSASRQKP